MIDRLVKQTVERYTSFEVSEDKRNVAILSGPNHMESPVEKLAEFKIEDVWDMIRDNMTTVDADPITSPDLFRRKGEAAAGILYTNRIYGGKK